MDTSKIVGEKIKALREDKSISIEELAQRSGLAIEQIERIENNIDIPSLAPLIKIARVLGVRLGTFLDDQDEVGPVVCRKKEAKDAISFSNNAIHSRKHMEYHSLSKSKADRHMEPFIIDVMPTQDTDFVLSSHEGEEFIMVMEGIMEISYGLNTICCEVQTWEEYDNYACDLTTYNSKFFLDKGAEKYDPMDIFTEYMVKALGHANQKIVKDYATRSGEALDWMLAELDPDYVAKYAHAVNYKGNKHFQNPCSHSYYYVGMTQWRDTGTETNTNNNMWPYTVRLLQQKAVEKGCEYIYGAQGLTLVHENGKVTGAIFTDIDGKYFQVNADAVIVAAGDFGGNPDMRLDLCDTLRNLAWSYGKDRTDVNNISSMGRDGSGIRMMLWAGATMEAGPRAGQAAGINSRPSFPFGGIWPIFGNDGKRFFNETITRHGSSAAVTMWPRTRLSPCAPARRTSTARTCRSTTAPTSPGTIWSCTRWSRWISARWIPSTIPNRCPTSPTASCGRTAATAWASSCCTAKRTSPATASVTRCWRPHAARCAMSSCNAARAGICWTMPLPRPSWPRRMNC